MMQTLCVDAASTIEMDEDETFQSVETEADEWSSEDSANLKSETGYVYLNLKPNLNSHFPYAFYHHLLQQKGEIPVKIENYLSGEKHLESALEELAAAADDEALEAEDEELLEMME